MILPSQSGSRCESKAMFLYRNKTVEISSKDNPHWIPPVLNETKQLQWRLRTMLCALLAAGPLILSVQTVYPYVARDHGLLSLLVGLGGAVATATLVALIAGRLATLRVASVAAVSLFFAARAVLYFVDLLIREQSRSLRALNGVNSLSTPFDNTPKVFLSVSAISISIGLLIGLVIALRRDE